MLRALIGVKIESLEVYMIIGVAGMPSSGKDTVAEMLEKKGFKHISLSQILRKLLKKKGEDLTTENLTKFGNSIRTSHGPGYLAKVALKSLGKNNTVITSIRQPGEVDVLRKRDDFKLVAVDATVENRWKRLSKRKREGDPKTLEELKTIEKKQSKAGGSKDMQNDVVMGMADFYIDNNGSLVGLKKQVSQVLNDIKKEEAGGKEA